MKVYFPTIQNNVHLIKLREHFAAVELRPVEVPPAATFVFLCYTNRCGSNYIAELIASAGDFNLAGEDLNYDTVISHSTKHGFTDFQSYFSYLVRTKMRSGVFFLKTAPSHLEILGRTGLLEQLSGSSHFILIERLDKLAQAVSFAIAIGTGRYTSLQVGVKAESELIFDNKLVSGIVNGFAESHKQFDIFFGRNGLVPENVIYEDFAADPQTALSSIGAKIGLPDLKAITQRVRIERQASSTNAMWRQLYLADNGR